ncbi:MAG: hypothetical protein ACXW27_03920 [Allosphingosinicella sp.]
MDFDNLVRTHYFHEADRRRDLNSSLSLPLGVLTALFAAIAAMIGAVSDPPGAMEAAVLGFASAAAFAGLRSIYFVIQAYLGYEYAHPPTMGEMSRWRAEIMSAGYSAFRANQEVEALMAARYAVCAERNALNNDQKSGYIHKAGEWLSGCLVLVILAGIPYSINKISPDAPTKAAQGNSADRKIG